MSANKQTQPLTVMEPLNDVARTQRMQLAGEKLVVADTFSVERISSLWLLRALSDVPVEVNGATTFEMILQGGETVVAGNAAFRFAPSENWGEPGSRQRLPVLEICLLLLLLIGLILWFTGQRLARPEQFVQMPEIRAAPRPQRGPVAGQDPRDVIAEARLDLSLYQFYIRERDANDGYLRAALLGLDDIQKRLETIQAPPDLINAVKKSKAEAATLLKQTVSILKNNAIIAALAGQRSEYRDTLDRIMQTTQDPSDPDYRWALLRLEGIST
jgi:hypothetical protein